jgi:hypothetical protein
LRLHAASRSPTPAVERLRQVLMETMAGNRQSRGNMSPAATGVKKRRAAI